MLFHGKIRILPEPDASRLSILPNIEYILIYSLYIPVRILYLVKSSVQFAEEPPPAHPSFYNAPIDFSGIM